MKTNENSMYFKAIRKNTGSKSEENLHQNGTHQGERDRKWGRGKRGKTVTAAWAHESPQVDMCLEQLEQGQVGNVILVGSGRVLVAKKSNQAHMDLASRTAESLTSSLGLEETICERKDGATVGHVSHQDFLYSKDISTKAPPPTMNVISTPNCFMKSREVSIVDDNELEQIKQHPQIEITNLIHMKLSHESHSKDKTHNDNVIFTYDVDNEVSINPQPNTERFNLETIDEVDIDDI